MEEIEEIKVNLKYLKLVHKELEKALKYFVDVDGLDEEYSQISVITETIKEEISERERKINEYEEEKEPDDYDQYLQHLFEEDDRRYEDNIFEKIGGNKND